MIPGIPYSSFLYLEILGLCIIMMAFLTRKAHIFYKYTTPSVRPKGYARYIANIVTCFLLFSEFVSYFVGSVFHAPRIFVHITASVYYSLCVAASLFWFFFYQTAFFPAKLQTARMRFIVSIPCILEILLILSSNFTGLVFSLSQYGWEHGPLYFTKPLISVSYYSLCCMLSVLGRKYARNRFDISRIRILELSPLPAIVFSILQSFTRFPIMCVGLVIAYTFLTFGFEAEERKNKNFLLQAISNDFVGLASFSLDSGELYYLSDEFAEGREAFSDLGFHDYMYYMNRFSTLYISENERKAFIDSTSKEKISEELSTKKSYSITFNLITDFGPKYYQFRFVPVPNTKKDRVVVLGLSNVDEQIRKEQLRQKEKEDYLRKSSMFQRAATVNALGSFECNLTKDLVIGEIMGRIDGKLTATPLDMFNGASTYTAYRFACAELLCDTEESKNLVLAKTSREYLLDCYSKGQNIIELKYWSRSMASDATCNRMLFFLSKDDFSDDILGLCITQDVTAEEQKSMEYTRQLEQAKKEAESASHAKSAFLFNMSHDIRTPMNSILGFTRIAQKNLDNKEKLADCLNKVEKSETHLLNLINDILDMARIENGKVELREAPLDIKLIGSNLADIVNSDISANNLIFSIELDEIEHPFVVADSLKLNEILLNILSNAIKYTHPGGSIRCSFSESESSKEGCGLYTFCISDTGIGMSKEFLSTIFDSFTREHTSTVSGVQGTGLGMAITKQLVELMGGTIEVESEPNLGTSVTVAIDLRYSDVPTLYEQPSFDDSTLFEGKRILIVEDNELNREIAVDILETYPFELETAGNGKEALDLFSSHEEGYYDLILMDVQMPVMDGYEASRRIRKLEMNRSKSVSIIAMTANVFEDDLKRATFAGMDGHISKPITPFEFWNEIRRCLR